MNRKTISTRMLAFALAAALAGGAVLLGQSANELFEKALVKERSEGDLRQAIKLYQTIVEKHGKERKLAAKALLHMGECYERLGQADARKAYDRLLRDYADQSDTAAEARTRLAALGPAPASHSGITTRQVWAGALDNEGAPSPDGRYVSFVDWSTGDLALRDLAAGENRRLTNKGTWEESEEFALFSVFSPDGKQIAYAWFNGDKSDTWDIRVASVEGAGIPKPRVLHHGEYALPYDWSKDGKQIVASIQGADRTEQIALISSADGSTRPLKKLGLAWPQKMTFSPDGRYVVYDYPLSEKAPQRDIFMLAADGSRESALVAHPSNDLFPVWAPDGKRIVFLSDRSGSMGAWMIRVEEGKAQGDPELIKADVGPMAPMAFTRGGSLFYSLRIGNSDVYVAAVAPASGKLEEPKRLTEQFSGMYHSPDWSPDGRFLAYVLRRFMPPMGMVIRVRTLEDSEERELRPDLVFVGSLRWSHDGKSLITWGTDRKERRGIFQMDAGTGRVTPITTGDDFRYPQWSPDGQWLYYFDNRDGRVLMRSLATGREAELLPAGRLKVQRLAISPDGRQLAMVIGHPEKKSSGIDVMPAAGGEPREILSLPSPRFIEWTPDNKHILFGRKNLWRISTEGGQPEKIAQDMPDMRNLRFDPDGRRVAFDAGQSKADIWVMENFLPELRAAR